MIPPAVRRCLALASILATLALTLPQEFAAAAERPNIVVFLVDDMGVMDTSVPSLTDDEGKPQRHPLNDLYRTPNMQRLAEQGIRCSQFYAMSVCSPTRVSILTGQNAARHHVTNWINPDRNNGGPQAPPDWDWQGLNPGDVTLPALLRDAGYRTIHVGKGHFAPRDEEGADPSKLGFDVNIAGASFGAPGSYYARENFGWGTRREHHAVPGLDKYHGKEVFLTEALTIEANAAVKEAVKAEQPFFLYFAQYAVHAPFQADPRFAAHYRDKNLSPQAQAFATLIEGMDKSLGDVLDQLEALGVAEDTLVVFLGDNGSDAPLGHQHEVACAAPLRGKKGAHYEGGMRVPFIAAWAKRDDANSHQQRISIPAGAIQTRVGAVQDLFPTVLEIAAVKAPADHPVDGVSLVDFVQGKRELEREDAFLMHYPHAPHRSDYFTVYREGPWKVIYHYLPSEVSGGSHYQLFHLGDDPYEQTDLAKEKPEELRRMMSRLIEALEQHHAQYPVDREGKPLPPRMPG